MEEPAGELWEDGHGDLALELEHLHGLFGKRHYESPKAPPTSRSQAQAARATAATAFDGRPPTHQPHLMETVQGMAWCDYGKPLWSRLMLSSPIYISLGIKWHYLNLHRKVAKALIYFIQAGRYQSKGRRR